MMFLRFGTTALVASIAAGSALAADLPMRSAPPPVVPAPLVYNWGGFYAGLNAGIAWGAGCSSVAPNYPGIPVGWVNSGCGFGGNSQGRFIGGAQAGYNWQTGAFVYGVETDLSGLANSSKTNSVTTAGVGPGLAAGTYTFSGSKDPNLAGTLRLRLGYAADRALFYLTGGLAYGNGSKKLTINHYDTLGALAGTWGASKNGSAIGWAAGAGVEYALSSNWTVRGEYLLLAFDGGSGSVTCIRAAGCSGSAALNWIVQNRPTYENILRAGVNYKFGGPTAPVLAKY